MYDLTEREHDAIVALVRATHALDDDHDVTIVTAYIANERHILHVDVIVASTITFNAQTVSIDMFVTPHA